MAKLIVKLIVALDEEQPLVYNMRGLCGYDDTLNSFYMLATQPNIRMQAGVTKLDKCLEKLVYW